MDLQYIGEINKYIEDPQIIGMSLGNYRDGEYYNIGNRRINIGS